MKQVGTDVTGALAKVVFPLDTDKIVNLIFPKSKGFTDLTPTERQQLLDPAKTAALTAYDADIEKRIISRIKRHLGKKDAAYDDQQLFGVQEALRRGWATVCWNSYGDFLINLENSLRHLTYSGGMVFQDGINETSLKNMPVFNDVFKLIDDAFPQAKGAILPGYVPAVTKTEQPQDADATDVTDVEPSRRKRRHLMLTEHKPLRLSMRRLVMTRLLIRRTQLLRLMRKARAEPIRRIRPMKRLTAKSW